MSLKKSLTYFIGLVWLVNGLFCKVLNLVPRHQEIVARILGGEYAGLLVTLIGAAEVVMAVWVWSRYRHRVNAVLQMAIIATMNVLEFVLAPDLLLWGRWNALYAFLFIFLIYYHEFHLEDS